MIDGAEEYRADEPGSVRNAGVVRRTSFPSTVDEDWRRRHLRTSLDAFMLKIASRWQSVNQWKSMTTATSSEENESTERIPSSWWDWLSLDAFMLKIASRWQSVNQWKSMTTAIVRSDSTLTVRKNIVLSYTYIHHTYYQSCVSCLTLLTCSHVSRNIYEIRHKSEKSAWEYTYIHIFPCTFSHLCGSGRLPAKP